ncbi:MAG: hypothetical protein LCH51_07855 [Bacteroidetes bacterium]|nr:hypothetical protein [Bacteroidota bacterium]
MPEQIIHIDQGKIVNRKKLADLFGQLTDGRYLVTIKSYQRRSLSQNRYWWGVLVPMVRAGLVDVGYNEIRDDLQAHAYLKQIFLSEQVVNVNTGEVITLPGTTTKLTTVDFMKLVDDIQQWAAEYLNIYIPNPNEQISLAE